MDITAMNKKIIVQKSAVETDEYGNHLLQWKDYFSCWATISGESGSESEQAGVQEVRKTFSVTIRYCPQTANISTDQFRVLIDGTAYNITNIDHLNFKRHALKLICDKEPFHVSE